MEQLQHPDHSVCAIVVTYHPTAEMICNLSAVATQTQDTIVVDNGSNPLELEPLRRASRDVPFRLIENHENLGIAEALNRGIACAKDKGFKWVILFDQDTPINPGFVDKMLQAWVSHPRTEIIGAMHPRYVDPITGTEPHVMRARDGGPITSMTSGALMPVWIFDKIGWFSAEYFIDQVDIEYCYRIRSAGYLVTDAQQVILYHMAGKTRDVQFLAMKCNTSHHSPLRRYYITRNRFAVCRKYFWKFPTYIIRYAYVGFKDTIKCFLFEENRLRKIQFVLLGILDGVIGKMGQRKLA